MIEDLSNCKIIKYPLTFYTYYDFVNRRYTIKYYFNKFDDIQKEFYKYYIYANTHCLLLFKDRMWDYLNGVCGDEELLRIVKQYKVH